MVKQFFLSCVLAHSSPSYAATSHATSTSSSADPRTPVSLTFQGGVLKVAHTDAASRAVVISDRGVITEEGAPLNVDDVNPRNLNNELTVDSSIDSGLGNADSDLKSSADSELQESELKQSQISPLKDRQINNNIVSLVQKQASIKQAAIVDHFKIDGNVVPEFIHVDQRISGVNPNGSVNPTKDQPKIVSPETNRDSVTGNVGKNVAEDVSNPKKNGSGKTTSGNVNGSGKTTTSGGGTMSTTSSSSSSSESESSLLNVQSSSIDTESLDSNAASASASSQNAVPGSLLSVGATELALASVGSAERSSIGHGTGISSSIAARVRVLSETVVNTALLKSQSTSGGVSVDHSSLKS
jgi:hypothetical protein